MPEPITESQQRAAQQLATVYRELGADGAALMHDVLIHGQSYKQIAAARGLAGQRWERYFGATVFLHLHTLAFVYGFAKSRRDNISAADLARFRDLAALLLGYSGKELDRAVMAGELLEVMCQ